MALNFFHIIFNHWSIQTTLLCVAYIAKILNSSKYLLKTEENLCISESMEPAKMYILFGRQSEGDMINSREIKQFLFSLILQCEEYSSITIKTLFNSLYSKYFAWKC